MNITEHADAILDAACAAPLSRHGWTNAERKAILAACQALHDEGYLAGAVAMQDRAPGCTRDNPCIECWREQAW